MFAACSVPPTDVYIPFLAAAEGEVKGSQNPQCEYSQSVSHYSFIHYVSTLNKATLCCACVFYETILNLWLITENSGIQAHINSKL